MIDYKMIYQDQVFNALSIDLILNGNISNSKYKIKFIRATYIDEDGEVKIIEDESWCFKFVRR